MAMKPKKFTLDEIEARVKDTIRNHEDDVRENAILRVGMGIFLEMDWLCKQLRKAQETASAAPPPADEDDLEEAA